MRLRGKLAVAFLGVSVLVALGAELVASELPLAVRVDGETHLLPGLTRPAALRGARQNELESHAEWIWKTPIPFGPNQTFAGRAHDEAPPWRPDGEHWLGTDELGRDLFARLLHGTRVSLAIGLLAVLLQVVLGLLLGGLAGYLGGKTDAVISRLTEVMMTFPTLFFLLAILGVLRGGSVLALILVLGLTRWTDVARLVRAEVLRLRQLDFVLATRALGASETRIFLRHVLPNALSPVAVNAAFAVAGAILLESALSFLGLGAPPPAVSWGELLTQAHRYLVHPGAWWLAVYPGLCIGLTVLALNELGESLRTFLDPRG